MLADWHSITAWLWPLTYMLSGYEPSGAVAYVQRNVLGTGVMGGALNVSTDGDNLVLVSWWIMTFGFGIRSISSGFGRRLDWLHQCSGSFWHRYRRCGTWTPKR